MTVSVTVSMSGTVTEAQAETLRHAADTFAEAGKTAGLTPTVEFSSPVGTQQQQLERKIVEDRQRQTGTPTPEQREQDRLRQEQIDKEKQDKERLERQAKK